MRIIFLATCISGLLVSCDMLNLAAPVVKKLHQFCVAGVGSESDLNGLRTAMLCGKRLGFTDLRKNLQRHSLIHLAVISGLHMHIMAQALSLAIRPKTPRRWWTLVGVLSLFAGLAGAQPPVIRALMGLLIKPLCQSLKLNWQPLQFCLFCGLLCLVVQPSWIGSYSFVLSWAATAGIALCRELRLRGPLALCAMVYLVIAFPLSSLGTPHPGSVLSNALLAAPLSLIFLAGSMLCFIVPPLDAPFDQLIAQLDFALERLSPALPTALPISTPRDQLPFYWIYLGAIHIAFEFYRWRKRSWYG